jgi:hypothetical protein
LPRRARIVTRWPPASSRARTRKYAAMIPALNREIPVVVAAEGVAQINDALTWAKEEGVRLVIRGGRDAIHVADRLRAENVPVILTATMAAPEREHESYDGAYSTPCPSARGGGDVRHRRRRRRPLQQSPAVGSGGGGGVRPAGRKSRACGHDQRRPDAWRGRPRRLAGGWQAGDASSSPRGRRST